MTEIYRTDIVWNPIDDWGRPFTPDWERQRSRFDTGFGITVDLLCRELAHLDADQILIQGDLTRAQIRLSDGWPKATSKVPPPIKISFNSKHGPLAYGTDKFDRWTDNFRAIAVALEALRLVDRYGVTTSGEQYKGWQALPTAGETDEVAYSRIAEFAHMSLDEVRSDPKRAVRQARIRTHPDQGGTVELFAQVQHFAEALGLT